MRVPSPMRGQSRFSEVPRADIPRSQFNRSHGVKTAFDSGKLVPILVDEVLPGDTFNVRMTAFGRLGTLVTPVMDNLFLDSFFFFVPYRLLWTNWEKFNGAQTDPGDSTSYTIPQHQPPPTSGFDVGKLLDYMGIPPEVGASTTSWSVNALPVRAYFRIFNEWFRDENLIDSYSHVGVYGGTWNPGDGPDYFGAGGPDLVRRGKRHDYFTSCLPWPQKGTAVDLPLGTVAPVIGADSEIPSFKSGGAGSGAGANLQAKTAVATPDVRVAGTGTWAANENLKWDDPNLKADLSTATAATINELRQAFQIQKLLERDARGGTRYTEIIKAHFGVTSPDARLQRAEYLGGGTSMVNVSPVPQTSETSTTAQGTLTAYGTVTANNHGFVKSFTEHGVLIGLVSVRADLTYFQGCERMWWRDTRYDYYWPALAHIGEQSVLNKEIYLQDTSADDTVFGYQERYAEYRYKPSRITGKMRSNLTGTLDIWHLAQDFSALPTLNKTFIEEDPPLDRVLAAGATEPEVLFDAYIDMKCARPMPVYGVPGLIDHF